MRSYIANLGVAISQLLNVAVFCGSPDETTSSRLARSRDSSWLAGLIARFLDWIDKDHSFDAIEFEPGTRAPEPHHLGDYDGRREAEENALKLALASEDPNDLDFVVLQLAESAAKRQRLRENYRDKYAGDIR